MIDSNAKLRSIQMPFCNKGGESAAIIYSLLVTCKLNEVEPEVWLREVIVKLNDWPSNRVHELLP